ncbi:hypothetical protein KC866_01210 [Patescibacteria group bacterium]|nr:hypothetical protein [Patescibacteria group bacterium]
MKKVITTLALGFVASPFVALAQGPGQDANGILAIIGGLLDRIIPILILAGLAYFIYGVVRFVIAGDADKKAEARQIVVQGIIGLFVIMSVWGIVFLLNRTLDINAGEVVRGNPAICVVGSTNQDCN